MDHKTQPVTHVKTRLQVGNALTSLPTRFAWQAGTHHSLDTLPTAGSALSPNALPAVGCTYAPHRHLLPRKSGAGTPGKTSSPSLSDAWGSISSALLTSCSQSHPHARNKAIHCKQETSSAPKAAWSDVTYERLHSHRRATPLDVGLGTMTKTKHLARGYSVSLHKSHSFFSFQPLGRQVS